MELVLIGPQCIISISLPPSHPLSPHNINVFHIYHHDTVALWQRLCQHKSLLQ